MATQSITFTYQEEATSKNFNRLLYNLVPKGIISGGELYFNEDADGHKDANSVRVSPMVCLFEDTLNKVMVKIELTSNESDPSDQDVIVSGISANARYIIGRYSWISYKENKMSFLAVNEANINPSDIILGEVHIKDGEISSFSYIKKSWSTLHYEIPKKLNFLPLIDTSNKFNLKVDCGEGYIDGYKVKNIDNINRSVNVLPSQYRTSGCVNKDLKGLITLARDSSCLFDDDSWNVNICCYWNDACCGYPPLTTREMPIAYVKLSKCDGEILSSCIDYIYNKSNQQNTTGLLTDYYYDSVNNRYSVTVGGTTKTATATGLLTNFSYDSSNGCYSVTVGGTTKTATTKDLFSNLCTKDECICAVIGGTGKSLNIFPSLGFDTSNNNLKIKVANKERCVDLSSLAIKVGCGGKQTSYEYLKSETCGVTRYYCIWTCFYHNGLFAGHFINNAPYGICTRSSDWSSSYESNSIKSTSDICGILF